MTDRWTSVQNIKFVELYGEQPNLWNVEDPNYRNREMRRASIEHMRAQMDLPDNFDVTTKIKNLRSTYHQELLKIEKSRQSGAAVIYRPSIKWFDAMDCILKNITPREKPMRCPRAELEPVPFPSTSWNEMCEESAEILKAENFDMSDNSNNTVDVQPMQPPKRPKQRTIYSPELSEIQAAVQEVRELRNSIRIAAPDSRISEEECDAIGRHVALQLRQLPPMERIDATDEIQAILSRYRKNVICASMVFDQSNYSSESASSPR